MLRFVHNKESYNICNEFTQSESVIIRDLLCRNYCQALQYLVPLLHSERDASKRVALRRKITEYLSRTEELKKVVNSDSDVVKNLSIPSLPKQETLKVSEYKGNREELLRLTITTPQIQAAIEIGASGELYAREGNYTIAFDKYQLALGKLLELLQSEPKGCRKDLLREEVTRWMTQAEYLKELLNNVPAQESDTVEPFASADEKNCVLQ